MIHATTRLDPATGMWQYLITTPKGQNYWSRPMTMIQLDRVAKFIYQKRLSVGKGTADKFYLGLQSLADMLEAEDVVIKKIPSTGGPKPIDRVAQARRWEKAKELPKSLTIAARDLLEDLGL